MKEYKNRIIIPLTLIFSIPIILLFILHVRSTYQLNINNQIQSNKKSLQTIYAFINYNENEEDNLNKISNSLIDNIIVKKNDSIILDTSLRKGFIEEDCLYQRVDISEFHWTIYLIIDKNEIFKDTIYSQIPFLLITFIILLTICSVIYFILEHTFRPIQIFKEAYMSIISGSDNSFKFKADSIVFKNFYTEVFKEINVTSKKYIEMKNLNENILDSINSGIIVSDIDGNIIKSNKIAVHIIEKTTRKAKEKLKIIEEINSLIENTLHSAKSLKQILNIKTTENDNIYMDISSSLMLDNESNIKGSIVLLNDITKQKLIEEKISRINKLTSLGNLTAGLAHEIRNPLSTIKMTCQILSTRLKNIIGQTEEKLIQSSLREIERLDSLINSLLDYSKPKSPNPLGIDISEIVDYVIHLSKGKFKEKVITFSKEYRHMNKKIYFDSNQFIQILLNLIINSINAIKSDGQIKIETDLIHHNIVLKIYDNGCGISSDDLEHIFDPFYSKFENGTGLGLSVVHQLIKANKSSIDIESTLDTGTVVKLNLPISGGNHGS